MFNAILFDLDGTIYKGKSVIPGAGSVVENLRKNGIRVFFLTNAATRSRDGVVKKLAEMGINAFKSEVYTSGYATAVYIKKNLPGKGVFCFGEDGLKEELTEHGIKIVNDESAEIVVVSLDRKIDYGKIATSYRAIINGAIFIATNDDADFPVEDGFLPGAGAMVAAVERCTGKKPVVIGKPNPYLARIVLAENNLKKNEALVVGDRLETDIKFAKNAGIKSALVLTGVTREKDLKMVSEKPDYILKSVLELPSLINRS